MLRVDVDGDTEGVIAEAGMQSLLIGITTCHADTVSDHLVDRLCRINEIKQSAL